MVEMKSSKINSVHCGLLLYICCVDECSLFYLYYKAALRACLSDVSCRFALETFSLAVLLTSLTTLRCLCVLGPSVQAWIRVFSRHG